MFIGRSYGDGIRPSSVQSLASAKEAGTRIVSVDPRLNKPASLERLGTITRHRPGVHPALSATCSSRRTSTTTASWSRAPRASTSPPPRPGTTRPEWAAKITDVPAERIRELARATAKAAPPPIEAGLARRHRLLVPELFETARAASAVNALLGSYGAKGGALLTSSPAAGKLVDARFADPPAPPGCWATRSTRSPSTAPARTWPPLKAALDGTIKGLFFYNSTPRRATRSRRCGKEARQKAELAVTIDVQMSETALQSDYVLPEVTYLSAWLPEWIGGKKHCGHAHRGHRQGAARRQDL